MKNRFILGLVLLLLLTTFISQKKISINNFKIKHIEIENNKVIKNQELIKDLSFLYNKNMIFLNLRWNSELSTLAMPPPPTYPWDTSIPRDGCLPIDSHHAPSLCLTVPYSALHCPALLDTASHCFMRPCTALHCLSLPYTALPCIANL